MARHEPEQAREAVVTRSTGRANCRYFPARVAGAERRRSAESWRLVGTHARDPTQVSDGAVSGGPLRNRLGSVRIDAARRGRRGHPGKIRGGPQRRGFRARNFAGRKPEDDRVRRLSRGDPLVARAAGRRRATGSARHRDECRQGQDPEQQLEQGRHSSDVAIMGPAIFVTRADPVDRVSFTAVLHGTSHGPRHPGASVSRQSRERTAHYRARSRTSRESSDVLCTTCIRTSRSTSRGSRPR